MLKLGLKDKSQAVRAVSSRHSLCETGMTKLSMQAYAQAIANLTKWASDKSLKSLMDHLWKLYTDAEADEIARAVTGYVLLLMARASSVLKEFYKILIPLVMLGR